MLFGVNADDVSDLESSRSLCCALTVAVAARAGSRPTFDAGLYVRWWASCVGGPR